MVYFRATRLVHYLKINNVIHHVNRLSDKKSCKIISVEAEHAFDKNSVFIHDKRCQKIRNKEEFPQLYKEPLQKQKTLQQRYP